MSMTRVIFKAETDENENNKENFEPFAKNAKQVFHGTESLSSNRWSNETVTTVMSENPVNPVNGMKTDKLSAVTSCLTSDLKSSQEKKFNTKAETVKADTFKVEPKVEKPTTDVKTTIECKPKAIKPPASIVRRSSTSFCMQNLIKKLQAVSVVDKDSYITDKQTIPHARMREIKCLFFIQGEIIESSSPSQFLFQFNQNELMVLTNEMRLVGHSLCLNFNVFSYQF